MTFSSRLELTDGLTPTKEKAPLETGLSLSDGLARTNEPPINIADSPFFSFSLNHDKPHLIASHNEKGVVPHSPCNVASNSPRRVRQPLPHGPPMDLRTNNRSRSPPLP